MLGSINQTQTVVMTDYPIFTQYITMVTTMKPSQYLLSAVANAHMTDNRIWFDVETGLYMSHVHEDAELRIELYQDDDGVLETASVRIVGSDKLVSTDVTVYRTSELIERVKYYFNRGWETETPKYEVVQTGNSETVQDDDIDLDAKFDELGEEFDNASTLQQYQVVANKWQVLKGLIEEHSAWSDFEDDMNILCQDINAAIKTFKPVAQDKPTEKVPAKTEPSDKPRPSVSLKKVAPKSPEDEPPIEGESVRTYACRVLKYQFNHNPTLNSKMFRIGDTTPEKVREQLQPYIDKYYPEYSQTWNVQNSSAPNRKSVDLIFPEPIPAIISDSTSLDDAVRRVRAHYNLLDLGLCDDSTDEYDCSREIAGILIDLAAEEGDVDLTQPLETYIELE